LEIERVSAEAPETVDPSPSVPFDNAVQLLPPFGKYCHWTVGAGVPEAVDMKLAALPASTV